MQSLIARSGKALVLAASTTYALQSVLVKPTHNGPEKSLAAQHATTRAKTGMDEEFELFQLPENETVERGSYCLDGNPGSYYVNAGTASKKWILAFEGGSEWCEDAETFAEQAPESSDAPATPVSGELSIFSSDPFKDFNHVIFHHCDGGLGMGDRGGAVNVNGQTIYMRGRRIVEHTIDDLIAKHNFGEAEEVLVVGGSGGGQATYLLADHLGTLMPSTVTKYGAIPMNGWHDMQQSSQEDGFIFHNMTEAIPSQCKNSMAENELWHCVHTDVAYKYSTTPMFVIQLLDYRTVSAKEDADSAMDAWHVCLFNDDEPCEQDQVDALKECVDEFTSAITGVDKSQKGDEGGFLSTCTKHIFYRLDEYFHYSSNGVTIDKAVQKWWEALGTGSTEHWYLPCELNNKFPHQCEASCMFGTDGEDQHVGDD